MKHNLNAETIATLIAAATKAKENTYVPYSKFRVGAALLMGDGSIVTGCNIENASFGATICAERTAISAAMANGKREIKAVCVTNDTETKITPCGICRQVIFEFARDVPVICCNADGEHMVLGIDELLPHAFEL